MDCERMCPHYEGVFEILGKRCTGLILRALMTRPRRFSEVSGYVEGLGDRMLLQRLAELEDTDIAERGVDVSHRPVLVEYALTEKGCALRPVLEAVQDWADRSIPSEVAVR